MADALESSFLRLRRSIEQAKVLEGEIRTFNKSAPYTVIAQKDGHGSKDWAIILRSEATKSTWGVLLGEILHNLRAALDNAIWEMIHLNNSTPVKGISGFPVKRYIVGWDKGRLPGAKMIQGIHPLAAAVIKDAQPFEARHNGGQPERQSLWVLNELWNIDKHRLLHTTIVATEIKTLEVIAHELGVQVWVTVNKGWTLNQEVELGRVHFSVPPKHPFLVKFDGTTRVAFSEAPTPDLDVRGLSVTEVIACLGNDVVSILQALRTIAMM